MNVDNNAKIQATLTYDVYIFQGVVTRSRYYNSTRGCGYEFIKEVKISFGYRILY